MFLSLSSLLFVTIVSAVPTGREDIVYPTIETSRSGEKRVKFKALGQDVDLRLESAGNIFSEDFGLYEGEEARRLPSSVHTLKNKLFKDNEKRAALYIDENDDGTSIEGVIGAKMRILPEQTVKNGRRAHRVFEVEEREDNHNIRLNDEIIPPGVKGENGSTIKRYREIVPPGIKGRLNVAESETERQGKQCIIFVVKVLIVTEYYFSNSFSSNAEYEKYLAITIVYTQTLIDTMNFKIEIKLNAFLKYTKNSQPSFIEKSTLPNYPQYFDCEALIDNMCKFYSTGSVALANNAHVIKMVSLRPMGDLVYGKLDLRTLGIAFVGGICEIKYKCGVSIDDPNDFHEFINTFAHELAHLLGCPHDEDPPVTYIKNSPGSLDCKWSYGHIMSYESNAVNGSKFSPCSAACAKHLLDLTKCVKVPCPV
uniref:Metalloserrulase 19 n=1 Tax=Tityus serrulatus TaxID=6887 RepID=A0A1S5QN56_TITSE|nr:metalloserrulase 19 [Tityus serrulatus]